MAIGINQWAVTAISLGILGIVYLPPSYSQTWKDPPSQAKPTTPSIPSSTDMSGAVVSIPKEVEFIYVFLQNPNRLRDADGCIPVAENISPQNFRQNFAEYRSEAARKGMRLIIAATDRARRDWVSGAGEIRINGKRLKPDTEYSCHAPRRDFGYAVEF